jgi:hypothetical protein
VLLERAMSPLQQKFDYTGRSRFLKFDSFCDRRGFRRNGCVAIEAERLGGYPVEVLVNENEPKVISVGELKPNMSFTSAITPRIGKGHDALGLVVLGPRKQVNWTG